ncbi:MAG: hypothetical protein J6M31_07845 [Bacteroidales bacterium]|nr:hypothetical protein [Bacteroidales bacterium]
MINNSWLRYLEDRTLLLFAEGGVFFFVVATLISELSEVLFWICITIAAICELLSIVRFVLLIKKYRAVNVNKFPSFLTLWQFLFLGFFYLSKSHDSLRKWMAIGLIAVSVIYVVVLVNKMIKERDY